MVYIKRATYIGTPKVFYEIDFTENPTRDPQEFSQVFGMSYAGADYDANRDYFSEWEEDYDSFVETWNQYWDALSQVPDRALLNFPYFLVISFGNNPTWAYGPFSADVNLWNAFVYVVRILGRPKTLAEVLFGEVQDEKYSEWTEDISYEFITDFKVRVDVVRKIRTEIEQRKWLFFKEDIVKENVNPYKFYLERDPALAFMFIDYYHLVDGYLVSNAEENLHSAINAGYEEYEEYEE